MFNRHHDHQKIQYIFPHIYIENQGRIYSFFPTSLVCILHKKLLYLATKVKMPNT